jgi:hypothetical protein
MKRNTFLKVLLGSILATLAVSSCQKGSSSNSSNKYDENGNLKNLTITGFIQTKGTTVQAVNN